MRRASSFQKLTDSILLNGSKVIDKLSKFTDSGDPSSGIQVDYHQDEEMVNVKYNKAVRPVHQFDSAQIKAKIRSNTNNNGNTEPLMSRVDSKSHRNEVKEEISSGGLGFGR
jgi:hypothetical protein